MARYLVIGAIALDRVIRLDQPWVSGGRLIATSLGGRLDGRLGGGGANAGVALRLAGHAAAVAAPIAKGAEGETLMALALSAGLDLDPCVQRDASAGRTLIMVEPDGERTIIGLDLSADRKLTPLSPPGPDAVFDGVFVRSAYPGAAAWAEAAGLVLLHWPAPSYAGRADVVIASAADLPGNVLSQPLAAARAALGPQVRAVVITRGEAGAAAHTDAEVLSCPVAPAVVRDTTGAGDIFAAGLMEALCAGAAWDRALRHASRWAALAVGLDASAPVDAPTGFFPPYA